MQYTQLGNTGLVVSRLCLGTMTFSDGAGIYEHIGAVDQDAADTLVKASIEAGINFFDTADIYSDGTSERTLGQAFRNLDLARHDVVLATKCYMRMYLFTAFSLPLSVSHGVDRWRPNRRE